MKTDRLAGAMGRVSLRRDGTIVLGANISCDGFAWEHAVRVQTHIHHDHMIGFDTSKANQTIVMSEETQALLNALYNADLPYRTNVVSIDYDSIYPVNGDTIELIRSHHMLGSVQVKVTCEDGYRIGYSSDFFWPVEDAIDVDELVIDATYGDPKSLRTYSQDTVDEKLIELVLQRLRGGHPTTMIGHNGRIQEAVHLLSTVTDRPILCSPKVFSLLEVYHRYGYAMPEALPTDSDDAVHLLRSREACLAFVTFAERRHLPWVDRSAKITLSAYMTGTDDPVIDYGNGDCRIAYTDHADFEGTLAYIEQTGAKRVWTDPRSGNAEALANAIQQQLGCHSAIIPQSKSLAWG